MDIWGQDSSDSVTGATVKPPVQAPEQGCRRWCPGTFWRAEPRDCEGVRRSGVCAQLCPKTQQDGEEGKGD